MFTHKFPRIGLGRLILILAVMSALITLANSFYASYRVQKQLLIDNTLEANRVYATKLAAVTDMFFINAQEQMAYSAQLIAGNFNDERKMQQEVDRLRLQTHVFNSVAIADSKGTIRTISPDTLQLKGHTPASPGINEALKMRRPLIGQPYVSAANNLLILISYPIFSPQNRYLGYISGTIYLKQKNILNDLLGDHYYRDGSYIYVIDKYKNIIYHKDVERIGRKMDNDQILDKSANGSQQLMSSSGVEMLAGYATVPTSSWQIVTLRPTHMTLRPLDGLMKNVLRHTFPIALVTLLGVWILARFISRPLWLLAHSANQMDASGVEDNIKHISSWYFEAAQLKKAMLVGINLLHKKIGKLKSEAQTDPMTGLYNRRALDTQLKYWREMKKSFAAISLDIDKFKRINDTWGHDVGDQVIITIARQLRLCSRDSDALFRTGGEEFLILLPETSLQAAALFSERLRSCVEQTVMPMAQPVTISVGVAMEQAGCTQPDIVFKQADNALYQAKQQGRNRVVIASPPQDTV
ncbi:diguanylate cyclase [Affinibrenneria salicis]|uniref:diguanylate cyclase n=1 Tax=Affinibrenneria salicis TaxID=2590031 RepID=A0A5J5G6P6_9GAMM|nr:sensor domain-containing diguanylate cyclase [Affinibrenneria salicis]KAA9002643.1 diguanylate cyclase [Affinibrenneria salicis]KAA9003069.1 diguanylate cyclase [Affinibrenneria salicis]